MAFILEMSVGVTDPKFPKSILLQVGPLIYIYIYMYIYLYICPPLSSTVASPVKRICPELTIVPEKEGLALDAPAALIVKLVVSDDKSYVCSNLDTFHIYSC